MEPAPAEAEAVAAGAPAAETAFAETVAEVAAEAAGLTEQQQQRMTLNRAAAIAKRAGKGKGKGRGGKKGRGRTAGGTVADSSSTESGSQEAGGDTASDINPSDIGSPMVDEESLFGPLNSGASHGAQQGPHATAQGEVQLSQGEQQGPLAAAQGQAQLSEHSERQRAERDANSPPQCCICQSALLPEERKLALQCAHAFHDECIRGYAQCKGLDLERACPFKCHVAFDVAVDVGPDEDGAVLAGEAAAQVSAVSAAAADIE